MTECQATTHSNPKYSHLHGDNVATHTMYRCCPECGFDEELAICTKYADYLFDQVVQRPYLQVTCPNCKSNIILEDLIDDIVPFDQEPNIEQVEYLIDGVFQEELPCESPSHTDPRTKSSHSEGEYGRYYIFGGCDSCEFTITKLYCHEYASGILTERELFPQAEMTCPQCKAESTINRWIKSVTNRSTGYTTQL